MKFSILRLDQCLLLYRNRTYGLGLGTLISTRNPREAFRYTVLFMATVASVPHCARLSTRENSLPKISSRLLSRISSSTAKYRHCNKKASNRTSNADSRNIRAIVYSINAPVRTHGFSSIQLGKSFMRVNIPLIDIRPGDCLRSQRFPDTDRLHVHECTYVLLCGSPRS